MTSFTIFLFLFLELLLLPHLTICFSSIVLVGGGIGIGGGNKVKRNNNNRRNQATVTTTTTKSSTNAATTVATTTTTTTTTSLQMVRNIDLAEAIIFYGRQSLFSSNNNNNNNNEIQFLPGVENLLQECKRDDTAVIAILEPSEQQTQTQQQQTQILQDEFIMDCNKNKISSSSSFQTIYIRKATQLPPNPRDLWECINNDNDNDNPVIIQPKGFGGSSGFGTKAADPERNPLPKHCVVLCHTVDQCRAARYAGMRVLCLTDNDLADAVIFQNNNDYESGWESIYMDDIATPGSFWLNPPHPRDDQGNAVDIESVMWAYENNNNDNDDENSSKFNSNNDDDDNGELSDDQLAAILADMDPL